ncbi:MAG: hypothetical protein IPL08_17805 [Saprospiraceae bacterium]|nr:hypothetical protein [Saprospiraceae bacterium]
MLEIIVFVLLQLMYPIIPASGLILKGSLVAGCLSLLWKQQPRSMLQKFENQETVVDVGSPSVLNTSSKKISVSITAKKNDDYIFQGEIFGIKDTFAGYLHHPC